jgi:hypothetical protein
MHPNTRFAIERPKEARMFDERLSTGSVTTWYVERRVAASEHDVTGALGEALRADAVDAETHAPIHTIRHGRPGAARGFTSRLRLGRLARPIAIEVEVEPWSRGESVLGVRPERRPAERVAKRYFAAATALLADVERCIAGRLDVPTPTEVRRAS